RRRRKCATRAADADRDDSDLPRFRRRARLVRRRFRRAFRGDARMGMAAMARRRHRLGVEALLRDHLNFMSKRGPMRSNRWGFILVAVMAVASDAAAQLTDSEQRLIAAIKARSPQALEFLEKTVRINS